MSITESYRPDEIMPLDESQGPGYTRGMSSLLTPPAAARFPSDPAPLRLAAIDLDGTLLGDDRQIGPENRRAVARLAAAGIEVVLASGRHYLSMLPYARQLPEVRWLVSAQGGEVSDVARTHVLDRRFLAPEQVAAIADVVGRRDVSALYYTPAAILTDASAHAGLDFYTALSGNHTQSVPTSALAGHSIFKVVVAASVAAIDELVARPDVARLDVQKVRTHRQIFEFQPHGVTKATALQTLTAHLGLAARQVVAFGDGDNDIPMFEWAGLSFAMPHGWPAAQARAHRVAPAGAPNSALARAVDLALP